MPIIISDALYYYKNKNIFLSPGERAFLKSIADGFLKYDLLNIIINKNNQYTEQSEQIYNQFKENYKESYRSVICAYRDNNGIKLEKALQNIDLCLIHI